MLNRRTFASVALIGALTLPGTVAAGEPPLGCGKEVCNVAVTVRLTNLPCDGKKDITVDPETLWVGTTAPKTIHWRIGNPPKDDVAFADGDPMTWTSQPPEGVFGKVENDGKRHFFRKDSPLVGEEHYYMYNVALKVKGADCKTDPTIANSGTHKTPKKGPNPKKQ